MVKFESTKVMIEKFEDLELSKGKSIEEIEQLIQEKLGISALEMKQELSKYVVDNAVSLTNEFINIAPLGDYGELIEDSDKITQFLKTEAHKVEHWDLKSIRVSASKESLLSFEFDNKSVDDGDCFNGYVFVSLDGKIKHAFAQNQD